MGISGSLLIVPYGIETDACNLETRRVCLLIVPYGIETWAWHCRFYNASTFNCTLWN